MSLNRLVLRLATVCALNNMKQAPYPTMAGVHIFDSKIESIENTEEDIAFPICVVYTDYDKDHWRLSAKNSSPRFVTVTFELLIAQVTSDEDGDGFTVSYPQNDSELETALDLFEAQLFVALQADNPAADCFRAMVSSYDNAISRRGATVESGQRLAARQITLECAVPREPANGTVPQYAAAFLDALEDNEDYGDRVALIKAGYTANASATAAEKLMAATMWSDKVAFILGHERGPVVTLGTPVVYVDSGTGSPL